MGDKEVNILGTPWSVQSLMLWVECRIGWRDLYQAMVRHGQIIGQIMGPH